jgi:GNAT superfamily N-acetyltransferase
MIEVQALRPAHRAAVSAFFTRVPAGDRTFFRDRVLDDGTIDAWLAEESALRLVALNCRTDSVVGVASLVTGSGWSAHVGSTEVVVDPAHRRRGVGRRLVQEVVRRGVAGGVAKFVVAALADQPSTVLLFESLGFAPEAILRAHVRDDAGEQHDLLLLAHFVEDNAAAFAVTGIAEALHR